MAAPRPNSKKDNQENESERSSRLYILIMLGIIVAALAIFIAMSHPSWPSTDPAPSRTSMVLTAPLPSGRAVLV